MTTLNRDFLYYRRSAGVFGGLLLVAFAGLYFFDVSAQTEDVEKPVMENLVNGRLAFSSRIVGPADPAGWMFTANPDGSGQTQLPIPTEARPAEPAWSPDGTRLAFASTQQSYDIFVINADGSGHTNLTNTGGAPIMESNPSWSVSGKIAYVRYPTPQGQNPQIWVMNTDGSGQTQFSAITQPSPTGPAWSPDGTKLAFASGGKIWVINADGSNEHPVTMTPSSVPGLVAGRLENRLCKRRRHRDHQCGRHK